MQCFKLLAAFFCQRSHTAFTDHQFDAGLLDELFLEGFHTHTRGWTDGDHLPFFTVLRTIGPCMENGFAVQVIRNRALQFDQATVANVTAGHQRAGQVNDIANANVCQIFGFDRGCGGSFS